MPISDLFTLPGYARCYPHLCLYTLTLMTLAKTMGLSDRVTRLSISNSFIDLPSLLELCKSRHVFYFKKGSIEGHVSIGRC